MDFKDQIQKLVDNRKLGSSSLLHKIIDCLWTNREIDSGSLNSGLEKLTSIDKSMVVIHHLLNFIQQDNVELEEVLNHYMTKWGDVDKQLTQRFGAFVDLKGKSILTHSNSGQVTICLFSMYEEGKEFFVYQTESEPGGEGKHQANRFMQKGITTRIVKDGHVKEILDKVDICILGCDHFSEKEFVNKVGSKMIVDICLKKGIEIYILGDSRKRVESSFSTKSIFEKVEFRSGVHLVSETEILTF